MPGSERMKTAPSQATTLAALRGLLLGLLAISTSPWPRYGLACLVLAVRRDARLRLARFLDWAYAAGLMRVSGTAVQFRHRELQAWLSTMQAGTD